MEVLNQIIEYIACLSARELQKKILILAGILILIILSLFYVIYNKSNKKTEYLKQLYVTMDKTSIVIDNNTKIQNEEDRIQELLLKNKDFNIKSYFEQFCREHTVTPEPNWDTTINPIAGNEKFEEVILPVTFKNQTTKTLTTLLDALDKNEIVYLKELQIKKEGQTITFNLTIATKKQRMVLSE